MSLFELLRTDGFARQGILHTRRGDVLTPTFMPDGTRGAVKSLTPEQVAGTGVQIMLSNTYHLHLQPGEKIIQQLGGLHAFSQWQGPILTDSGGFQVFSLSKIRRITEEGVHFKDPRTGDDVFLSPEISMQIQYALGSDFIVAFDDLTGLDESTRGREQEAFERTHRWLERSVTEFQRLTAGQADTERPQLFGVVQGGLSESLRKQSLELVQALPVDGIAVGGLSVGESRAEMHAVLDLLAPLYDPTRPHFLLGVGDPIDVRHAIERGIDMLDCVLPTRNARHATVWAADTNAYAAADLGSADINNDALAASLDQKIHLTNAQYEADASPIELGCDCYACANGFSKAFLRHQFKVGEPLAGTLASIHNLRYLSRICESYRR